MLYWHKTEYPNFKLFYRNLRNMKKRFSLLFIALLLVGFLSAEKYYIREAELYPLHVIPYMRLLYFYQKMRNVHNFRVVEKMLEEVLKKRSLTLVDLEIIRQYPEYDTRPWEIPGELRAKVQKEMAARQNKAKK